MVTASGTRQSFSEVLKNGEMVRFRYFTESGADANYDNDVTLTKSGIDTWVSGFVQPIDLSRGSNEAVLFQQGKLVTDDLKLYVDGRTNLNPSGLFRVGIGSANPPAREYAMAEAGVIPWNINGDDVYKKIYLRHLTTGSLPDE